MMICAWVLPRTTPNTGIARLDRFLVRNFSLRGLYRVGYVARLERKGGAKNLGHIAAIRGDSKGKLGGGFGFRYTLRYT